MCAATDPDIDVSEMAQQYDTTTCNMSHTYIATQAVSVQIVAHELVLTF